MVNGDAPATNGELKTDNTETPSGDAAAIEDDKKDAEETKENGEVEAEGIFFVYWNRSINIFLFYFIRTQIYMLFRNIWLLF